MQVAEFVPQRLGTFTPLQTAFSSTPCRIRKWFLRNLGGRDMSTNAIVGSAISSVRRSAVRRHRHAFSKSLREPGLQELTELSCSLEMRDGIQFLECGR